MDVKNKLFSVIGMGRTGFATAQFLARRGARVLLTDKKSRPEIDANFDELDSNISLQFGDIAPDMQSDAIVLSPGVNIHLPEITEAQTRGIEVLSEIELAFRFCDVPVIAITGTNGKTTTTTLVANLLRNAGMDIRVGGNIGTPFISLIDDLPKDYVVLEISSFQLEAIHSFRPKIAMILNITPDHLDRHASMEEYQSLKARITKNQTPNDVLVLNRDDAQVRAIASQSRASQAGFSVQERVACGAYLENGSIYFAGNSGATLICELSQLQTALHWQIENILAMVTVAGLLNIRPEVCRKTLAEFNGLEHRLEWVRQMNGIDFINDSKSTNRGSLEKSLTCFDRPVILIAGGQDKASDFSGLKKLFKSKLKHLVMIGEAASKFYPELNGSFSHEDAGSLEDAVQKANAQAQAGDVVLLSPGCASFDMFKNYEDRGNQFKRLVNQLNE